MYRRRKTARKSRRVKTRRSSLGRRKRSLRKVSRRKRKSTPRSGMKMRRSVAKSANPTMMDVQAVAIETSKRSSARLKSRGNFINKVVTANLQSSILRFQAINRYMNRTELQRNTAFTYGGAYSLQNVGVPTQTFCPLHLYDITCSPNIVNTTVTQPVVAQVLTLRTGAVPFSTPTSTNFEYLYGDSLAGSDGVSTGWQQEQLPSGFGTVVYPNRRTLLEWVSLDMFCYGAILMPVTYTVSVVKFSKDYLHPGMGGIDFNAIDDVRLDRLNFWLRQIKSDISHPLALEGQTGNARLKVLKTQSFTLQPSSNAVGEGGITNPAPRTKRFTMKIAINDVMKYDWNDRVNTDNNILDPGSTIENKGEMSTYVDYKKRIYIMVQATNRAPTENDSSDWRFSPSYDIVIRKKYTNIT
ncbi:capsid protein [Sewage-associated circular DNA virus-10]|uniref:capsid protein n=1 Tax=Sewage-associated circular DNA virus-10 TaxID=1519386 RepID=UPI0004D13763|nr:capsid protein [Sewage-associated circular DNA virus-10]AIF34797.1 capsid protein [Sewage-associated circular DNA virus-10]